MQKVNQKGSPREAGLIHILVVLILLAGLGATLYLSQKTQIFKPRARELPLASQNTEKKAEDLTLQLINGEPRLTQGRPPLENEPEKTLDQIAAERKSVMLELARSNPNQFLRVAITPEIRNTLSPDVAANVEKKEIREGILEVIHGDDFDNKKSEMFYILKTPRENISLYSPKDFPELKSNSTIRVEGLKLDNVMVLGKPEKNLTVTAENAVPREGGSEGSQDETHGEQKIAVILVNFQNNPATPWTREYVKDLIFNKPDSVNAYYKEASYNQTGLSGDVFGWYTINSSNQYHQYQVNHCGYNDLEKLFSDAVAASDPDINFRDFTRVVVAFPNLGPCSFGGWGDIGYTSFTTADGTIVASKAWINGESSMTTGVVAHELGHNFGLHHARAYSCSSGVVGGRCTRQEYGDPFDVMGQQNGHFNAPHKAYLNWFAPSEIQTVTSNGKFTIHPLESASSGIKLLKVPKEISANNIVNKWYYLEYRQPVGFDKNFIQYNSEENIQRLQNGLVVHFEALGPARQLSNYTYLLDMTPDTQYFSDSPIRVGENYLDPTTDAGFTPVEKVNSGIVVDVRMPARKCIRANPTIDISPTAATTGPAGQRQYYFVTVTNNDNPFCTSPSTYNFEYSISSSNPSANTAGWTFQLISSNSQPISFLTLNPGETKPLQFILTSPQTPDGYYDFGIKLVNNADASFTDSVTGTYIVLSSRPCPTTIPRPTINPNAGGEATPTTIIVSPCPLPSVQPSLIPSPRPNQPPTASVSGPTTWTRNSPVTFNANFHDSDRNLARGEIYLMRTDAQPFGDNCPNNDIVGSACRLRVIGINGVAENENLSATISPSPGQYFVFVQAYDSAGARCSAAYQNLGSDWSDCGDKDFLVLTVL